MSVKKLNRKRKEKTRKVNDFAHLKRKMEEQEKNIYDLKQLLEISKSLNSMIEFSRLMEAILYVVMAQMKTFGVAIFTKSITDKKTFVLYKDVYGFDIEQDKKYEIPEDHQLIRYLTETDSCVSPEQLESLFAECGDTDEIVQTLLSMNASLFVPMKVKKHLIGFLILGKQIGDASGYGTYEQDMILSIGNLAAIAINNAQLLEMTTTDMMTRLKLKHYFFAVLAEKLETISPTGDLSVLMFDIDDFKKVNDTYGHECGDIVLQQVANIIKTSVRSTDLAARYGGEEFVVVLPEANIDGACIIAERVRSRVENMEIIYNDQSIKVTISIGVAQYLHNNEDANELVNRSDIALYISKRSGKNMYSISEKNLKTKE